MTREHVQSIKLNLSRTKLDAGTDWDDKTVDSLRAYVLAEVQKNHPDATITCVDAGDADHSSVGVAHVHSDLPHWSGKEADLHNEARSARDDWSDDGRYCIFCSAYSACPMPGGNDGPPAPSTEDDRGWKAVAAVHHLGCEWVVTREFERKAYYGKYRVKIPAELEFELENTAQPYTAKTLKSMRRVVAYAEAEALVPRRHGPDVAEIGVARICLDMSTKKISYSWTDSTSDEGYITRDEIPESAWRPAVSRRAARRARHE